MKQKAEARKTARHGFAHQLRAVDSDAPVHGARHSTACRSDHVTRRRCRDDLDADRSPRRCARTSARAMSRQPGAGRAARARSRHHARGGGAVRVQPGSTETFRQPGPRGSPRVARRTMASAVRRDSGHPRDRGPARAILTGERTALNFLQLLSGTATVARRYVDAVARYRLRRCSTRARPCPGCAARRNTPCAAAAPQNHRMGLFDMLLIKENHIAAAGSLTAAIAAARAQRARRARGG